LLADGKAFPPVAISTEVRMPDQRALLVWSNGVERLAIETRIVGEGTNFAWVVPLPAAPRVDATTTGLFPTLAWLTPPNVVHAPPPWPGWMLSVTAILWLTSRVRRGTPVEKVDWVACLGVAGGMLWVGGPGPGGAALAGVALALAVWVVLRVQAARPVWRDFLLVLCILFLLVGMLLPALSTAGGSVSAPGAGVEVVDRQVAGVFETTTLSARDPAALGSWLRTNGYRLPPSAEPVIADYVREGWVFVASRIRRDAATSGPTALHPLVFTFPTREPVYPLRLTGVDNGPLKVELFVLGPERARIDGFKVLDARVTAHPEVDPELPYQWLDRRVLNVVHPQLRALAPDAAFATRLEATLSPEQMRSDAVVHWDGTNEVRSVRYSRPGARLTVVAWMVGGICLVVLTVGWGMRFRGWSGRSAGRIVTVGMALAVVVGGGWYATLPVVPVRLEWRFAAKRMLSDAPWVLRLAVIDHFPTNAAPTVEQVREAIAAGLRRETEPRWSALREEDSPRNYRVRAVAGDVEVGYYDDYGRELSFRVKEVLEADKLRRRSRPQSKPRVRSPAL
jgi:hypothetical protein